MIDEVKNALHMISFHSLQIDDNVGLKGFLEDELEEVAAAGEQELVGGDHHPVLAQQPHVVEIFVLTEIFHKIDKIVPKIVPI